MKFKLVVLASGFSKLFTTREAAERFAELVLGLKQGAFRVDAIAWRLGGLPISRELFKVRINWNSDSIARSGYVDLPWQNVDLSDCGALQPARFQSRKSRSEPVRDCLRSTLFTGLI
jgi:hypothetical protein